MSKTSQAFPNPCWRLWVWFWCELASKKSSYPRPGFQRGRNSWCVLRAGHQTPPASGLSSLFIPLSRSAFLLEIAQVCGWNSVSRGESRSSRQRFSCCLWHIVSLFYFFFSFCFHDFTTPSRSFPDFCLFVCLLLLVLGAVKSWKHKGKDKGGSVGTYEKFTRLPPLAPPLPRGGALGDSWISAGALDSPRTGLDRRKHKPWAVLFGSVVRPC